MQYLYGSFSEEEYRAFGLRSIPTCVDYSFDEEDPEGTSLLLFGDDAGGVSVVTFSQPVNSLFAKAEVDSVQCVFWPDVNTKVTLHAQTRVLLYSHSAT